MPNQVLSEALKQAYAVAPTSVVIINTLEVRHPDFRDEDGNLSAIRIVNAHEDLLAFLEDDAPLDAGKEVTFKQLSFSLTFPKVDDKATADANITIDNVNREFTRNIERAIESQKPIKITYRPYLNTNLSEPHFNPPLHLTLTNIVASLNSISGRAGFGDLSNRSFPNDFYTPERFPGLVR